MSPDDILAIEAEASAGLRAARAATSEGSREVSVWIDPKRTSDAVGHWVRFHDRRGTRIGGVYFGTGLWFGWCDVETKEVTSGHYTRERAAEQLADHYAMEHRP